MRSRTNKHHGFPYSFGGSDDAINISDVEIGEHDMFHRITGHLPPDFLMRLNVIRMIGWGDSKGKVPSSEYFSDMLDVLTPDTHASLYHRNAIRRSDSLTRPMRAQTALHIFTALGAESKHIHDAIGYLGGSRDYVEKDTRYKLEEFMTFFRNSNPMRAIGSYLTDTNEHDQFKWTKPLLAESRADIQHITRTARLEHISSQWIARMIRILNFQKGEIQKRQEAWNPSLHNYIQDIAAHGFDHITRVKQRHRKP